MKTWLLVADAGRARFLETHGPGKPLVPVPGYDLAETVPPSHDLGTDRPSRTHELVGQSRHAIEPKTDPHRQMKRAFADQIAQKLEAAASAKAFDRLVVIAAPVTLGDLRQAIGKETRARIAAEIPKDLVKCADHELRAHIGDVIVV